MKKRAWLVYPVLAAAATTVYYLVGQNSLLFNLIGLTSPILIIVAVKIHAPEKRWPWYLIAIGQFLFIAGDVVSYNYVLFHDVFPQLFPLDFAFNPAGDVPFPGPADALVPRGVSLPHHGLAADDPRAQSGAGPHQPAGLARWWRSAWPPCRGCC